MGTVEQAIREGVIFEAHDRGDGGPILFHWTCPRLDLECDMGEESLGHAASNALEAIRLEALDRKREAFDLVLRLALNSNVFERDDPQEYQRQLDAIKVVEGFRRKLNHTID